MENDVSFTALLDDSFSDHDRSVEDYASKLKDALVSLTERYNADSLQQVLQQYFSCSTNSLDERILNEILPFACGLLSQVLKRVGEIIERNFDGDTLDDARRQLSVCHELLSLWEKSMEHVSKHHGTPAVQLKCTVENVLVAVQLIFEHCRGSKNFYDTLFEDLSAQLTSLFRKAKAILNLFLATLEGVMVFDTDREPETELLVKVIDSLGSFVAVSHDLDLKTFVETSKAFGKLAIAHQQSVKRKNASSVTSHLSQMTRDVSSMIEFCKETNNRSEDRRVKVIGHSLKILNKLFAAYSACINSETLTPAIELLSRMHRCSPLCLKNARIDDKLIESIDVHVWRGAEPMLSTVSRIPGFEQSFLEHESSVDRLGYHLLTVSVMKLLLATSSEQQRECTLGAEAIVDIALTNVHHLQEEICLGQVRSPGVHDIGERPRSAALYEATLVPICGLISRTPADGFHAIELILLKHLLSDQLWSSLLSADVWCFVGRIGSSELCADHVKYLLKLYGALVKRRDSLQVVMLENLIGRLYGLLAEETRHSLLTEFQDHANPCWLPISRFLPPRTKSFLRDRLLSPSNAIPRALADLRQRPGEENWNRLATLLCWTGKLSPADRESDVEALTQLWNSIADTVDIVEGRQLDILAEFVPMLLAATRPENIQDDAFASILEAVTASLVSLPSHVRAIASHHLRNSADSFDNIGARTTSALSELNCRLLEDENPWVRQEAFESFDLVAHTCPNEDLVTRMAAAVAGKPSLSESLPAYLSGTCHYRLLDFAGLESYLRHVARRSGSRRHVCSDHGESQREEKHARLECRSVQGSDEAATPSDADETATRICDELAEILKKSADLSGHVARRLRSTCAKVLSLLEDK